jgi:hypothetical protein
MPKRVQLRGGTTASHAIFTGAQREITVDTDKKVVVVHDGTQAGGYPLARADQVLNPDNNLSDVDNAADVRDNLAVPSETDVYGLVKGLRQSNGIYFDGLASTYKLYASLGSYSIGTNTFTLRIILKVPETNPTARRTIAILSSSNSAIAANGFSVSLYGNYLEVRKYGASTSDYIYSQHQPFVSNYAGKTVELEIVRRSTGIAVYVNGSAVVMSDSVTVGAGSTWGSTVSASYAVLGCGGVDDQNYKGEFYGFSIFNYAMTAADVESVVENGIASSDLWPDEVQVITATADRDFSGANSWTNSGLSSFNATTDLSLTANGSNQKAVLPAGSMATPYAGFRYVVTFDVTALTVADGFYARFSTGEALDDIGATGQFEESFINETTVWGDFEIVSNESGSIDLDNFSIRQAGAVLDLDFAMAAYRQVHDRSPNKLHALTTDSQIIFRNAPSFGRVRGRTNTNGNQQLLGAVCIPTNARIRGIIINSDNSGTPVTSVNIGNASTGSQIASGVTIASGRNEVGTFVSRFSSTGSIWINANGTSNLDITVLYDLVD